MWPKTLVTNNAVYGLCTNKFSTAQDCHTNQLIRLRFQSRAKVFCLMLWNREVCRNCSQVDEVQYCHIFYLSVSVLDLFPYSESFILFDLKGCICLQLKTGCSVTNLYLSSCFPTSSSDSLRQLSAKYCPFLHCSLEFLHHPFVFQQRAGGIRSYL